MDYFYREFLDEKIESKTFKITEESKERIHFISQALDIKQGDVIEMLLDYYFSNEELYNYLLASSLDDQMDFLKIRSEFIDSFSEFVKSKGVGELEGDSSKGKLFNSFINTLENYLSNEGGGVIKKFINENKKLRKLFSEQLETRKFIMIFPYITHQMYQTYQELFNVTDINEDNLKFLNALAIKVEPTKYVAIRFDTTKTLVQSIIKFYINKDDGLLKLWQKFNINIVSKFEGDYSFQNIYIYISESKTDEYVELIGVLDKSLEEIKSMAPPFQSECLI